MLRLPQISRTPDYTDQLVMGHKFRVARWAASERTREKPLLFFTGIGANIELLSPFLERICGRDILTFDMPGVGRTPDYGQPYRFSAMANAASKILGNFGYDTVDVMGVSWGGMLAQEFAYRYPNNVNRLILAATSPGMTMIPGAPSTLWKMVTGRRYEAPEFSQSTLQKLYGGVGNELDTYASRMQAPSSTGYLHQILALMGWTSVRKLTCISAKTLILMGQEDRVVPPANGHFLKLLLHNAQLEFIPNAGHLFVLTHTDEVTLLIDEFLTDQKRSEPVSAGGQRLVPLQVNG